MALVRSFLFPFLSVSLLLQVSAQQKELLELGGLQVFTTGETLPEQLTSSRSAVIVSLKPRQGRFEQRADWRTFSEELHRNIRKIGIDPIVYLYQDDLNAGPEVTAEYLNILKEREVKNLVYVRQNDSDPGGAYTLMVTGYSAEGLVHGQPAWKTSHDELERIMLRLGRQVLRQELERSNFLIPETPEFLDDVVICSGSRLENFPSRLKSLPIAVTSFQRVELTGGEGPELTRIIDEYNREIDSLNAELERILQNYPFQYELVEETEADKLYDAGFQYVLLPVCTSAKSIKKILNYQTHDSETDYMSVSFNAEGKRDLKKIPVNAWSCKYYIKQTIVGDIHTGDSWDADTSWQGALDHFIRNLRAAFRL